MTTPPVTHFELPQTPHHVAKAISLRGLADVKKANGFNAKVAVILTNLVGSMWCAYCFALIALVSLPAILTAGNFVAKGTFPHWLISAGLIALIAWIAQTFLQLVLLSVIMVGQQVQATASDTRAQRTYEDTVDIIDALNTETIGGLTTVLEAVRELKQQIPEPVASVTTLPSAPRRARPAVKKATVKRAAPKK